MNETWRQDGDLSSGAKLAAWYNDLLFDTGHDAHRTRCTISV